MTGQSLYYPRVMMRTLAQVLTEEYSEHGVHVANIVIDGLIDSPGTRAAARPTAAGGGDESGQDRRSVLLPPYPRQVVLDARAAIDALLDQAELLRASRRPDACRAWRSVLLSSSPWAFVPFPPSGEGPDGPAPTQSRQGWDGEEARLGHATRKAPTSLPGITLGRAERLRESA